MQCILVVETMPARPQAHNCKFAQGGEVSAGIEVDYEDIIANSPLRKGNNQIPLYDRQPKTTNLLRIYPKVRAAHAKKATKERDTGIVFNGGTDKTKQRRLSSKQ